jgi:hypothetical protein
MLLWILGHSGIQDNECVVALAREGLSSPFLNLRPTISVSPCVDRSVLLFACETWKSTENILKDLQTFINGCLRRSFARRQYQMKNSGVLPIYTFGTTN